jgi:hypothetical protein
MGDVQHQSLQRGASGERMSSRACYFGTRFDHPGAVRCRVVGLRMVVVDAYVSGCGCVALLCQDTRQHLSPRQLVRKHEQWKPRGLRFGRESVGGVYHCLSWERSRSHADAGCSNSRPSHVHMYLLSSSCMQLQEADSCSFFTPELPCRSTSLLTS